MRDRWSRVYAQANSMEGMPPIELYKVDDVYFVRDGNHRVSVARQIGQKSIEAHVTELPTRLTWNRGCPPRNWMLPRRTPRFLQMTRLNFNRPHHQSITLSEPQRYVDLLGHVYLHQRALELDSGHEVSLADAAADWYDRVYRPAVTLIRKYEILQHFPGRTEGDLYLWLVDHSARSRQDGRRSDGAHLQPGAGRPAERTSQADPGRSAQGADDHTVMPRRGRRCRMRWKPIERNWLTKSDVDSAAGQAVGGSDRIDRRYVRASRHEG